MSVFKKSSSLALLLFLSSFVHNINSQGKVNLVPKEQAKEIYKEILFNHNVKRTKQIPRQEYVRNFDDLLKDNFELFEKDPNVLYELLDFLYKGIELKLYDIPRFSAVLTDRSTLDPDPFNDPVPWLPYVFYHLEDIFVDNPKSLQKLFDVAEARGDTIVFFALYEKKYNKAFSENKIKRDDYLAQFAKTILASLKFERYSFVFDIINEGGDSFDCHKTGTAEDCLNILEEKVILDTYIEIIKKEIAKDPISDVASRVIDLILNSSNGERAMAKNPKVKAEVEKLQKQIKK